MANTIQRTEMETQSLKWLKDLGLSASTLDMLGDALNGVQLRDLAREVQYVASKAGQRAFDAANGR